MLDRFRRVDPGGPTVSLRPVRTFVVLSLLVLAIGCKGKPKHQEPPANLGSATGRQSGPGELKPAPDIQLPHGDGSPPVKTTGTLDAATLDKLQKMSFKGFQLSAHGRVAGLMEVRQTTEDFPKIRATVTVAACDKERPCWPMTLEAWKPHFGEMKAVLLLEELRDLPDTVFDINMTTVNGVGFIYQYQLAQSPMVPQEAPGSGSAKAATKETAKGSGAAGSANKPTFDPGHLAFSHAYTLFYNDGHNQIRVVAEYKDDAATSKEAMAKLVPKEDLEAIAKAFADVYTHAW
jgi:hypothetical protein